MDQTPLSPWTYFGLELLYSIPIIGVLFLIVHAIGASNINKRNFARSYFCLLVIIAILFVLLFLTGSLSDLLSRFG